MSMLNPQDQEVWETPFPPFLSRTATTDLDFAKGASTAGVCNHQLFFLLFDHLTHVDDGVLVTFMLPLPSLMSFLL